MEHQNVPNPILSCVLKGDLEGLQKLLMDVANPRHKKVLQPLLEYDIVERSPVHIACVLGHSNIIQEFAKYNVNLNDSTTRGYVPLHYAAAWGHLQAVKTLVELGADIQAVNFLGESARDIALRYAKQDCVEFLDWAEAKLSLQMYISSVHSAVTEQEKGKINKEEKVRCLSACKAKSEWLTNVKNPTKQDLMDQKQQLEGAVLPTLTKLHPERVKSGKLL
uniref:Ankyrin repeat domain-containing protein 45 n=1 Tax=Geotrypetes seraphini TaxID=260995 RepID=A0A6P8N707_GEOSA|nr:ankyrin repeat domain-containing protein 45 [Geotrypetes seraphini]XP_033771321.1 ankyrin repeat domain-containing protein 45 [Geotrypetes seraphini]XP_033771322.1 ankyrin repeat domain-containing protein 45 [Geotrypetes seraphini]